MKKLILFFILILTSCKFVDVNNEIIYVNKVTNSKVKIVAVGDNLIHHTVYKSGYENGNYHFKPIYARIKPYIKKHDLAFVNQETILGGTELGLSTYPRFNSPYEIGDALVDCGFNLVSLANNHTLDRGEEAIINSINYWQKQDVIYSGSEITESSMVKTFTKNDINFAFIAYTYGTNGIPVPEGKDYLVNLFSYDKASADIKSIRELVDVVIVSMHWGLEYYDTPNNEQLEQAHFLSSLGVDIILGHHPHVIQPFDIIELYGNKTYVIYSLGNLLSDQLGVDRLIGTTFSLDINKKINNDNIEIIINNPKAKLFYTYKNNNKFELRFFNEVNDTMLPNYKTYYIRKIDLLTSLNSEINVT